MATKTVLPRVGILVDIEVPEGCAEADDLDGQAYRDVSCQVSGAIDAVLGHGEDSPLGWVSERPVVLEGDLNCGQCTVCSAWVSDAEQSDRIRELQIGAVVVGELLCAEHLPQTHRKCSPRPTWRVRRVA